nr:putative capsid [Marmot picobirnavirus]AVX53762.1 putative capsid [Marmot picobirnavirus]
MRKSKKRKGSRGSQNSRSFRRDQETTPKQSASSDSALEQRAVSDKDNDWRWYAQNETLLKAYGSFPFGVALGVQPQTGITTVDEGAVPGIMALNFTPLVGVADSPNSPINVASRNIYSYVRHANSGHANYDAPDLMLYLVAMDSALMYYAYLRRLIGVQNLYLQQNRYTPPVLTKAMGVDFNDLQKHLVDIRGYANQYAVKLGAMAIPNSMSYMARHQWMCDNIYVDSQMSSKAQWYMYTPDAFYKFSRNSETQAGQLTLTESISTRTREGRNYLLFDDLVELGNLLIDPILQEEDMNIMAGDILKAFGDSGVYKLYAIPEGYTVIPSYSQEVLSQIENAICGNGVIISGDVTQRTGVDEGYLTSNPFVSYITKWASKTSCPSGDCTIGSNSWGFRNIIEPVFNGNKIINFHWSEPSAADVMVATRLTPAFRLSKTDDWSVHVSSGYVQYYVPLKAVGSEIINACVIWSFKGQTREAVSTQIGYFQAYGIPGRDGGDNMTVLDEMSTMTSLLSCFDWHPAVMFGAVGFGVGASPVYDDIRGMCGFEMDIDNYTFLTGDNLLNLHTTALLSEFTVPMMGAASMSGI